ncbi:MAG: carbohydrate kinase family protein [Promethearchaeota archaeon]|jgi:ribokinase
MTSENFDVICIGAALIDMVAQVKRHPIEDDEVFVSDLKLFSGGAAANTAYACAKLGLKTAFLGMIGHYDTFGNKILNEFKEVGVNTTLVKYSTNYNTGSAYVALNEEGDRRIYAHSGAANYLSKDNIEEKQLSNSKILFLSSLKNIESFIEAAKIGRNLNIPVILNPGMLIIEQGLTNIEDLITKVDILIISQREYHVLFNIKEEIVNPSSVKLRAEDLFKVGIKVIIITMGSKGAMLITSHKSVLIPTFKINKAIDTTGAGDAFSAGFVFGFIQNLSYNFEDLTHDTNIGNFVASRCVQKLGARNGIPDVEEILII